MPLLGYDVDPRGSRLIVNESEARRVRAIFELYLEHQSLIAVIAELDRRGWVNKRWKTRKGPERGGNPFSKQSLHKLLTNVTYLGKIKYKTEVHAGEHAAIVSEELWKRVQALLERNGRMGGPCARNKFGALLKGLLHCVPCGCGMSPTHATRNGTIRYRYYVCNHAQKRGWHNCPSRSIPAGEIERFVVEQIKLASQDPALLHEVVAQARVQGKSRLEELEAERRSLERELGTWSTEVRSLLDHIAPGDSNTPAIARLADLQERIRLAERRSTEVREQVIALGSQIVDQREVTQAMTVFDPVWESLTPREQTRVIHLLVQRVDYDGASGKVSITFHPKGIKTLADELASQDTEDAA
jgi:site-specific DNA recombinase